MCVIEHQLVCVLREARDLLRAGLIEALLIDFHAQTAGEHCSVGFRLLGIGDVGSAHGLEIFLHTLPIQTGLLEILRRTHKGAGFPPNRCTQSAERAAGLGSEKDQSFVSLFRDGDEYSFVVYGFAPGFYTCKPGFRRRIGCTPQERDHHQVADGLAIGKVSMNPETIASLKVWYLGYGQSRPRPLHPHLDLGANQVERGALLRGGRQ